MVVVVVWKWCGSGSDGSTGGGDLEVDDAYLEAKDHHDCLTRGKEKNLRHKEDAEEEDRLELPTLAPPPFSTIAGGRKKPFTACSNSGGQGRSSNSVEAGGESEGCGLLCRVCRCAWTSCISSSFSTQRTIP